MGNFVNQRKQKRNTNEKKNPVMRFEPQTSVLRECHHNHYTITLLPSYSNKIIILVCFTCPSFELTIHIHEHERMSLGHVNAYLACIKWSAVIFPCLSSEGAIQSGCHRVCLQTEFHGIREVHMQNKMNAFFNNKTS